MFMKTLEEFIFHMKNKTKVKMHLQLSVSYFLKQECLVDYSFILLERICSVLTE